MYKNFDEWNEVKKNTNSDELNRFYSVREIWWCRIGVNIGVEQDGKGKFFARPCVIVKSFGKESALIVPLSKSNRKHKYRIPIGQVEGVQAIANISQVRTVDTKRFERKIGFMDIENFAKLKKAIGKMFR